MEPIAVVGIGLRFPGAAVTPSAFWDLLLGKECTAKPWPRDRLNIDAFHDAVRKDPSSIAAREAHFLEADPGSFDASYFRSTAQEAAVMDPQQCMLLETTYQALENAGISVDKIRGSNTGVYAGTMCDDHKHHLFQDIDSIPKYAATGSSAAVLANRVSWFFDLAGPSITLDTACSSSLTALHIACQGLILRETSMAIVGGTNILTEVEAPIAMTRMGFLSPSGRCYSFDERANGYARGEGVGVVILKRLSAALEANDTVRAVIRATGVNQDGFTRGITVPNEKSQAMLIKTTYEKAGIDLSSTRYFESHGTGTRVGDPLEAAGIGSAFRCYRSETDPLYIGTLKPNIGHLEGASGIAGLIKAVSVVEKGIIPPNANFEVPNSQIPPEVLEILQFPTTAIPWPADGLRRVSINSFGFGGSNAHVVIDDADGYFRERAIVGHHSTSRPEMDATCNGDHTASVSHFLLVWSANSEASLQATIRSYQVYSQENALTTFSQKWLTNLAYTLSCRRTHHRWRSYALVSSLEELAGLKQVSKKPERSREHVDIAFVFTGQGAQYKGMGLQFLAYPVFRDTLLACETAFRSSGCSWSLIDMLGNDDTSIDRPEYSQSLSTALQIALLALLSSFNIVPRYVVGHSSGEIAAAYAIGAISLESACRLALLRGQLAGYVIDSSEEGAMLAVALSKTQIVPYLDKAQNKFHHLTVACINSPKNITVAGPAVQIRKLKEYLDHDSIFCRELKTGVAYHSSQMDDVSERYRLAIGKVQPGPISRDTAMASSLTGKWISDIKVLQSPSYWVQNMVQPVLFDEAMGTMLRSSPISDQRIDIAEIIEVGPHASLQRPISECLSAYDHTAGYTNMISRFDPTTKSILQMAGHLHSLGLPVRLDQVNRLDLCHEDRYKCLTDLPSYVFDRSGDNPRSKLNPGHKQRTHFPFPLLGSPVLGSLPQWRRNLNAQQFPWLRDHSINDVVLFPAAGMLAIAVEAAYCMAKKDRTITGIAIRNGTFSSPIVVDPEDDSGVDVETTLSALSTPDDHDSSQWDIRISARQDGRWTRAFSAIVQVKFEETASSRELGCGEGERLTLYRRQYDRLRGTCNWKIDIPTIYSHMSWMGLQYGRSFQGLDEVQWDKLFSATGRISEAQMKSLSRDGAEHFLVHPAVVDALFQLAYVIRTEGATKPIPTSVPAQFSQIWFSDMWLKGNNINQQELFTCNTTRAHGFGGLDTSAIVLTKTGDVVMTVDHLQTSMTASDHIDGETEVPKRLCYDLQMKPDIAFLSPYLLEQFLNHASDPLLALLDLILHKNPDARILDMTPEAKSYKMISKYKQQYRMIRGSYNFSCISKILKDSIHDEFPEECTTGLIQFTAQNTEKELPSSGSAASLYDAILLPFSGSTAVDLMRLLTARGRLIYLGKKRHDMPNNRFEKDEATQNFSSMVTVEDSSDHNAPVTYLATCSLRAQPAQPFHTNVTIVVDGSNAQANLAHELCLFLSPFFEVSTFIVSLSDVVDTLPQPGTTVVFLVELTQPFLRNTDSDRLLHLQTWFESCDRVIWVTKGNSISECPDHDMVTGLARVLRSEYPTTSLTTVSFSFESRITDDIQILCQLLSQWTATSAQETEYSVKDGIVHIPRVMENKVLDDMIFAKTCPRMRPVTIEYAGHMELEIKRPGVFDTLRCVPLLGIEDDLGDDQVQVEVHALGLNFKDVVIALGRLPQRTLGYECAGVITRTGRNSRLKPGDRVMMAQNGCMKTLNTCHQDLVTLIPPSLSFEEAAAIPIVGVTAYYSLIERARIREGESVLIHSGAGATGQMCIQIAMHVGAKVYTTVGSIEKRDFLVSRFGVRKEHIFYSRDTSFAPKIMSATENQGVDVVINSTAGDRLRASWEIIAPFGRFIELGRTEIVANSKLSMVHFAKNVSFMAVAVDDMISLRPSLVQTMLSAVNQMLTERKLQLPEPLHVYSLSEAEQAFRYLKSGRSTGKFVISIKSDDVVQAFTTEKVATRLNPEATYIVAGGLGGLGRSAARWMASQGARHLVLLTRSGPSSESAQKLIHDLQKAGVQVAAPACDVSSEEALKSVLADCAASMPPVRGCIQGTMTLRDSLFENMTYEDWSVVIRSKVLASSNLDKLLPSGMDFFILLSSLSAVVGLRGQANYAAGNAFQDALARSRILRGEKAISLDLGVMNKIGVVAESADLGRRIGNHMLRVEEEEFHALLEYYCLSTDHGSRYQALIGLPTGEGMPTSGGGELPTTYNQPLFSHVRRLGTQGTDSNPSKNVDSGSDHRDRFTLANSSAEAANVVVQGLTDKLSRALQMGVEDIDQSKPLHHYGVDSILAVELRNFFTKDFGANVPMFRILDAPSILAVGQLVAGASSLRSGMN